MVSVGSVDFTGREEMFDKLEDTISKKDILKDYMIFDEDGHTVWLIWYEGVNV